jgi:hypothetical protein
VGVALLLAGCGGGSSASRSAVSTYLTHVGKVETSLASSLNTVSNANRAFAKSPDGAKARQQVARSQAALERLRRRLAALKPPPEAKHLHALLLQLVDREYDLAGEVAALADFLPRYREALAPLSPASRRLAAELAGKKTPAADKAAALQRYAATVEAVEASVRVLHPPPVSASAWRQETAMLAAVRRSGDALAAGLLDPHVKDLPKLLHDFDVASAANRTVAAQQAQIAAVKAYNGRVARLTRIAVAIQHEQARVGRLVA